MFIKINIQCKFLILLLCLASSVYICNDELAFAGIAPFAANNVQTIASSASALLLAACFPEEIQVMQCC